MLQKSSYMQCCCFRSATSSTITGWLQRIFTYSACKLLVSIVINVLKQVQERPYCKDNVGPVKFRAVFEFFQSRCLPVKVDECKYGPVFIRSLDESSLNLNFFILIVNSYKLTLYYNDSISSTYLQNVSNTWLFKP